MTIAIITHIATITHRARTLRLGRGQSGAVAIEMAIVLPVLLILAFGAIDGTAVLSDQRRVHYAATVVADTVTRLESPTTVVEVRDAFAAAGIVTRDSFTQDIRIEVRNFWRDPANGQVRLRWDVDNGRGPVCAPVDVGTVGPLMERVNEQETNPARFIWNDIVVASVCVNHRTVSSVLLPNWASSVGEVFVLRGQVFMRPRGGPGADLWCDSC